MSDSRAAPTAAPDLPRETGGFRLLRTLGQGGMGVVYEAEELVSGRRGALKVLARELWLSGEAFERFRREARIAASVSDSNCVFVFGAHQIDGAPAIAMELCAGETLEHRLRRGDPVPIDEAVRWTIEILDGLEAAHQVGVVHRDVKPSNCFFTADGRVKVGDFGLARSIEQDVQLTQSGVFLGSPLYASPEQIRGRTVDLKSDIYSVGATLYALLTGKSPYRGVNLGEVLGRILSEPPEPPSTLRPAIPRGLEKVILRAMARDPAQRFPTHAALREALRPFASRESQAASPVRRFFAYMVDSGVLSLLQLPLLGIWTRFDPTSIQPRADQPWRLRSAALMLALGLLGAAYFALAEGLFGRTVGKWITGQRVVLAGAARGAVPLRIARALLWSAPGLAIVALSLGNWNLPAWLDAILNSGAATLFCNLALLSTMRRRNGWRGVHELLSRTRVVAEPLPFARFVRHRTPPPARLEPADLVSPSLGSYAVHGRVGRTPSGDLYEASDTNLDRRVWIHVSRPGAAPIAPARRSLDRATRLRWLDAFEHGGTRHEVFEAPGGARLLECAAGRTGLAWPTTHGVLSTLADELGRETSATISLDQLWIDRSWNLRILDEPLGERSLPAEAPLELLSAVVRASLGGGEDSGSHLPPDLPEHAEPIVRRLLCLAEPFGSVEEVRASLSRSASRPQGLTWRIRGLQMLIGSGLLTLGCGISMVSTQVIVMPQARQAGAAAAMLREAGTGRALTPEDLEKDAATPTGPELDSAALADRMLLISDLEERSRQWGQGMRLKPTEEELSLIRRAKAEHAGAAPDAFTAARARVEAARPPGFDYASSRPVRMFQVARFVIPLGGSILFAASAVILALILRGGLSLRLLSIVPRDERGRRAGRLRCAWRALLTGLPFVALYFPPVLLSASRSPNLALLALGTAVVLHVALVALALRDPARGWQDRIAGTRLVPR